MESSRKLILLDVDGTLIGMDGIIPPSALEACRKARAKGHLIYVCTGRAAMEMPEGIVSAGFDGIASSGGAHIESGGKVIFDAVMPAELAEEIAVYLNSRRCGFSLEKTWVILSNERFIAHWENVKRQMELQDMNTAMMTALIAKISENPLPHNLEQSHYEGVNKIVFVDSGSVSLDAVREIFGNRCEIFRGSFPFSGRESGEIGPGGVHKGSALKKIAEHHGIPLEHTIAFGDNDNDHPMIQCAAIGIAMGNAASSLKHIADDIISSLEDDGIHNGFVKHNLI